MDRIQDKANKIFNEVRKREIKVNHTNTPKDHKDRRENDIRNVSDLTDSSCLFCAKVFFSPNYAMKHMYRRHAQDIVKLHKKCLLLDSNNSNDFKSLCKFLEEEFLVLKNELHDVKHAASHKIPGEECKEKDESSKESMEHTCHVSKNCVESDMADPSNEFKEIELLKEKVQNIEFNIQSLHNKFEELDSVVKTEVSFRQEMIKHNILKEENFLREQESQLNEMRQVLLMELKGFVSKELNDNNLKWKSQFAELKHDILKLDQVISGLKQQIDSPDYLTTVEERLKKQIENFLGTSNRSVVQRKNSRSRSRSKLSLSKRHNGVQNEKISEPNNSNKQITNSNRAESVQHQHTAEFDKLHISPEELSFLIAERLSEFNISENTSKLPTTEYEEKLKVINSIKDNLSKKYHNFSEIYSNIDRCADCEALSKLQSRRTRKLRFSEPLISEGMSHSLKRDKADIMNKTYPSLKDKNENSLPEYSKILPSEYKSSAVFGKQRFNIPRSEGFPFSDVGGEGECCSRNFPEVYNNPIIETFTKDNKIRSPISLEKPDYSNQRPSSCTDMPMSSDAPNNTGCETAEIENTPHYIGDDLKKQDSLMFKFLKSSDNEDLYDINSVFDKSSLSTLSSLEEESEKEFSNVELP